MKSVVIVWLVVLSLVAAAGRSTPENCMQICLLTCPFPVVFILDTDLCIPYCKARCPYYKEDTSSSPMDFNHNNNRYLFCKLGCSTSLCTKFLTNKHSDEKNVKSCVDACTQACTNTMNK